MRAAFRVSHGVLLTLPPSMIVRPPVPFIEYCILINSWVSHRFFQVLTILVLLDIRWLLTRLLWLLPSLGVCKDSEAHKASTTIRDTSLGKLQ